MRIHHKGFQQSDQKVGGPVQLSQTRPIPRSPDGDKKHTTKQGKSTAARLNVDETDPRLLLIQKCISLCALTIIVQDKI